MSPELRALANRDDHATPTAGAMSTTHPARLMKVRKFVYCLVSPETDLFAPIPAATAEMGRGRWRVDRPPCGHTIHARPGSVFRVG